MTSHVKVSQWNDSTHSWVLDVCHLPGYWQSKTCHTEKWNQSLILDVWLKTLLCVKLSFIWVGRSFSERCPFSFSHKFPRNSHLCHWNTSPHPTGVQPCVQLTCSSDQDPRSLNPSGPSPDAQHTTTHSSLPSAALTANSFQNSSFQNKSDKGRSKGLHSLNRTLVSELTQTVGELSWIPLLVRRHKWLQTNPSVLQQTSKAHISLHYAVA